MANHNLLQMLVNTESEQRVEEIIPQHVNHCTALILILCFARLAL